jgi:predicted metal-dependent hydrolase
MTAERRTIVGADGRAKAYRPLPADERDAAVRAGLDAYRRGDFFLAHELMEPAWMGSDDPSERALVQGLIKLAAAEVHEVRGNPRGVAKNLEGALGWLRLARDGGMTGPDGVDLPGLIEAIERRLAEPVASRDGSGSLSIQPIPLDWSTS